MPGSKDIEADSIAATSRSVLETAPSGTTYQPRPLEFHPIIATMREQELGKNVLSLAIPIAVATVHQKSAIQLGPELYFIQIVLATGCLAIWNGIMLRKPYPRAASLVEQSGISLLFLEFNMLLSSVIPKGFTWFPVMFFGFFVLPFSLAALRRQNAA